VGYPVIGDVPLSQVDNLTLKPLIEKMSGSLSARTVNKYVEYIKQVVKSLKAPNGEPVFNRTSDAEVMDLPIVEYSEQKRPSLKATTVSGLITGSNGQEQALYVLLAATGMRISEALGLEVRHIINGRTIKVEQQIEKDRPQIAKYLKTNASKREIDLHPDVAEYLRQYAADKSGLLFHTTNGTPHLYGNLEDRWLTPRLVKLRLDEEGMCAATHSNVSVRRGFEALVVWKTSTISGWLTSRRRCRKSTRTFTRSSKRASPRPSGLAMGSRFRRLLLQVLQKSRRASRCKLRHN
jgi:integrase